MAQKWEIKSRIMELEGRANELDREYEFQSDEADRLKDEIVRCETSARQTDGFKSDQYKAEARQFIAQYEHVMSKRSDIALEQSSIYAQIKELNRDIDKDEIPRAEQGTPEVEKSSDKDKERDEEDIKVASGRDLGDDFEDR